MSCLKFVKPVAVIRRSTRSKVFPIRMLSEECDKTKIVEKNKCTTKGVSLKPCKAVFPQRKPPVPKQKPQYAFQLTSMWENPSCCPPFCETMWRYDIEYLTPCAPWYERSYQRTWFQFPERVLKKKSCSISAGHQPPLPEKRERGKGNPDAKWITQLHECAKVKDRTEPCLKCKLRVKCIKPKGPCCKKRCTLYPSYSECYKRCPKPIRMIECPSRICLCDVNEYLHERGLLKKEE